MINSTGKSLVEFWSDKDTKNNVHKYLIEYLEQEAIKKVFAREDVTAVADAREIIDHAFDHMDVMFESKPKENLSINQSR